MFLELFAFGVLFEQAKIRAAIIAASFLRNAGAPRFCKALPYKEEKCTNSMSFSPLSFEGVGIMRYPYILSKQSEGYGIFAV